MIKGSLGSRMRQKKHTDCQVYGPNCLSMYLSLQKGSWSFKTTLSKKSGNQKYIDIFIAVIYLIGSPFCIARAYPHSENYPLKLSFIWVFYYRELCVHTLTHLVQDMDQFYFYIIIPLGIYIQMVCKALCFFWFI